MEHDNRFDEEQFEEVVILIDEHGHEREYLIVEVFECDNKSYAVIVLANPESEEDGFLMRIEEDENGEEYLIDIEDNSEWYIAAKHFGEMIVEMEGQNE